MNNKYKERYNILLKELCYDILKIIGNNEDEDITKNYLRLKCRAILWNNKGKNMNDSNNFQMIWVDDKESNVMHAAFYKKSKTFCSKKLGKEMKFKTLYDYSNFPKCKECLRIINNIYKGIM